MQQLALVAVAVVQVVVVVVVNTAAIAPLLLLLLHNNNNQTCKEYDSHCRCHWPGGILKYATSQIWNANKAGKFYWPSWAMRLDDAGGVSRARLETAKWLIRKAIFSIVRCSFRARKAIAFHGDRCERANYLFILQAWIYLFIIYLLRLFKRIA